MRAYEQPSKTPQRHVRARAEFRLAPELALNISIKTIFLTRAVSGDSRAENVLPPCGQRTAGIGKAMSVTSGTKSESGLGETIRVVIHALLIALVIRTFLFQPFNIPSGSMKATLLVGDYLFVSKYSYGYSHYSIPLSPPLFSGRIFGSEPDARRYRRVPPAEGRLHRLHQARDRPAGRPHPDAGGPAPHQRQAGQARAAVAISSARTPAAPTPPRGSSAGRKRCRTASAMNRSIASTTASTTTPTSTPCRPATSS